MKKKGNFYRAVIKLLGILFLLFVGLRQHAPAFPVCRFPCWRLVPRKALSLRPATPTWSGFPRFAGAHVGVALLAKPLSFVEPRQHAPAFSGSPASLLAPTSPQSLCPSSSHANTPWLFPICRRLCWRRPLRKAFVLRRATPTPKSIEPEICVIQNERKTALPISSRSFFTKIRSCRNYSAITVPTQALPVHAALPSSVSR